MSRHPELLIPASSLEVLKTAVYYGADAVYIGGEMYGLRAKAKNFSKEDMAEGIRFAHEHGKKVYVTANITAHDRDLEGVQKYFEELKEIGPDALIISDPGVFQIATEICPEIDIHISTQANNVNYRTFQFWHKLGATRVVTARELSIKEIADIDAHIPEDLEIETFVHGAMCISYSGRCLLSNYFTGRDANLGACTHPCRWKYYIMEENRPGEYLPVEENERLLVPARAVFESLGAEVEWDEEKEVVTATDGETEIVMQIDNAVMEKSKKGEEEEISLEAAPRIIGERTMVPLRAVSEAFSAKVDYIEELNRVVIDKQPAPSPDPNWCPPWYKRMFGCSK